MPKKVIWILLADAGKARIFERAAPKGDLIEIQGLSHSHELTREHGPDKPGRGFESSGGRRHAYEPKTDWHEHQKEHFAKELAALLHKSHEDKKFDELYLLAPSKMLGFIRHHVAQLDHQVVSKISKEFPKDAINFTSRDLQKYLDETP
jgi:protein required for attachment to host cells